MKKFQHHILALTFAILLTFTLAACGDSLTTKTGVLVEASMHVISIQAPDGTTYTFGVDDNTTIEGSELLGNTVSASFYGEYSSGIIAVSVRTITEVDHAGSSGKGSIDDPGASQPREPASTDDTIWYMTGTVKDMTSNSLQLLYEDGHTYRVTIDSNTKVDHGVVVGSTARVFHKGRMVDGMVATEIHFIAQAPNSVPRALSDSELSQLSEIFDIPGAHLYLLTFLSCTYNSPQEIDPNIIFYSGAGRFIPPSEEILDYLIENGYLPEDYREWTDFAAGSASILQPSDVEDVLQKRFGISLSQVEIEFTMTYLERFSVYFAKVTDTLLPIITVISGEYLGNDTYTMDYYGDEMKTYRVTFRYFNNDFNTMQFISNVIID